MGSFALQPQRMGKAQTFIVTDESVNEYGFRVLTAGIRTASFLRNPVGFFNHQREKGVICRWHNLRTEGSQMLAEVEFDTSDDVGKAIAGKVERGFIKAASIGFRVLAISEAPELMLPGQTMPTVTECELVEISVVDIPGNRNALALYDEAGNRIDLNAAQPLQLFFTELQTKNLNMQTLKLTAATITALGLGDNATAEQIEASVKAKDTEIARLKGELQTLQEARQSELKARVKTLLDAAIADKRLTEAERADYEALGMGNLALLEKTLAKLSAPALPAGNVKPATGANPKQAEGLKALVNNRTLRQLEKEDPKLALRIRKDEPELYAELYEAQYGRPYKNI